MSYTLLFCLKRKLEILHLPKKKTYSDQICNFTSQCTENSQITNTRRMGTRWAEEDTPGQAFTVRNSHISLPCHHYSQPKNLDVLTWAISP